MNNIYITINLYYRSTTAFNNSSLRKSLNIYFVNLHQTLKKITEMNEMKELQRRNKRQYTIPVLTTLNVVLHQLFYFHQ